MRNHAKLLFHLVLGVGAAVYAFSFLKPGADNKVSTPISSQLSEEIQPDEVKPGEVKYLLVRISADESGELTTEYVENPQVAGLFRRLVLLDKPAKH